MNCPHVWNCFGPCFILFCRAGLALPIISTFSLLAWVAIALIAARIISLSYMPPSKLVKRGVYQFSIRKVPL